MQENQTSYTNPEIAPRKRRKIIPTIFGILVLVSIIFIGFSVSKAYGIANKVFVNNISFVKRISSVIDGSALIGESEGQINILILGYGGPEHDGPYLTDSIIIASINPSTKQVLLSTLPRDYLWDESPVITKINTAYSTGYFRSNGDHAAAGKMATEAVEEATGLKIPYFASIDFKGFEKAVDRLGGLDIYVENTFVDPIFPNDETKGYLGPLTFKQGWEKMNGKRALQFARSRHAVGVEASDFARSRRQAKILQAFKDKALELNLVSNSSKVNDLLGILSEHFHTNLEPGELIHLGKLMKSGEAKIINQSLDEATGLVCGGFLGPEEARQYVLVPCSGVTKAEIKNFFKHGFEFAALRGEQTSVILEQGGSDKELYEDIKEKLNQAGITVFEVVYKGLPIQKSVLYTVDDFPATETYLEELLKTKSQPIPTQLKASSDFVIIVGEE